MTLQLGRRDHHHVVYHHDHGVVFGGAWQAPASIDEIIENSLGWCRNTGVNVFDFHINSISRHTLGLDRCAQCEPPFAHMGYWGLYETVRHNRQMGVDVVAEICRAMRAEGIAFWIGIRVNDIHHTTGGESVQPQFWIEHPECRTGESVAWDPGRSPGALDFAHPAVRDYTKGIVQRTLDLYDVDGIELDFNRMPILLKSGEVDQHRDTVTEWVREVRTVIDDAARKRGHAVVLEARVPSVAEQCCRMGADALRWIDEEIVHILTASATRYAEFEMPVGPFLEAARDRSTLVFAGIEGLQPDGVLSREMYRAWAYHYWRMGVDGLHLFNNCYNFIYGGGPHPIDELHDPEWLARLGKRYVVTRAIPGNALRQAADAALSYPKQLPCELAERADGSGAAVTVTVDDDLDRARESDSLEALTLRLRIMELTGADRIEIKVNGKPVEEDSIRIRGSGWDRRQVNLPGVYSEPLWNAAASGAYRWILCDLTRADHLRTGPNEVEVILAEKNSEVIAPLVLYNVEVDVKLRQAKFEGNRDMGRFD